MPTNATCPGTVTVNPQAACLANLPPPPTLSIQSIALNEGAPVPDRTFVIDAGADSFFIVRGPNVGLPEIRVVSEGLAFQALQLNFTTVKCNPAGTPQPNCVMVYARPQPFPPGTSLTMSQTGRIGLLTSHNQGQSFSVAVRAPAPAVKAMPGTGPAPVAGGSPGSPGARTQIPAQSTSTRLEIVNCSGPLYQGRTLSCQIMATISGPGYPQTITGNIAEISPGAAYLKSISPPTFTIPAGQTGAAQVGAFEVTSNEFRDPNESPGRPAPGSQPWATYATIRAWAVVPVTSGTTTAETTTGVLVYAAQ
jgi:hypothetical protein